MNNRLNTNKKAVSSRFFLIIAALIIISGVAIIFFLSSGDAPEPDDKVVRKSIRVTNPTGGTDKVAASSKAKTRVTTASVETAPAKAVLPEKAALSAKAVSSIKESTAKSKAASPAKFAKTKGREIYAIHVASFHGDKYARRLEKAIDRVGYNAYITTFVKDGVTWHRVRVGFFRSKDDAKKTAAIISKRFKQPGAWIVRPPKEEVEKNKI